MSARPVSTAPLAAAVGACLALGPLGALLGPQEAPAPLTLAELPSVGLLVVQALVVLAIGVWVVLHATDTQRSSRGGYAMMRAVRIVLALLVRVADACDRAAGWLAATAGLVVALDPREVAHVTGRPSLRVVGGAS